MASTVRLIEMWNRNLWLTLCEVWPSQQIMEMDGDYTRANQQCHAGSVPVEEDIELGLVTCKHNWLMTTAQLWTVEIANATLVRSLYHLILFPNTFAEAKMLLTYLQCKGKTFFPGNWFTISSCSQSPALCDFLLCHLSLVYSSVSPKFCSSIAVRSPVWSYPMLSFCFIFLTASHRKFSHGGFVKGLLSLCVASDLFLFFSSCHSFLLLSLSCLLNLICIFPQLLHWRYLQISCSACSKWDSSILLLSFKSNSCLYIFFLLSHSFLCNLRWGPHFSVQLRILGLGENWDCCHLTLSHQSNLCLDLKYLCSLSWSNPVNAFIQIVSACPFPER